MRGAITPLPNTTSWRGAKLKKKHRDNFTFYLISLDMNHVLRYQYHLLFMVCNKFIDDGSFLRIFVEFGSSFI